MMALKKRFRVTDDVSGCSWMEERVDVDALIHVAQTMAEALKVYADPAFWIKFVALPEGTAVTVERSGQIGLIKYRGDMPKPATDLCRPAQEALDLWHESKVDESRGK